MLRIRNSGQDAQSFLVPDQLFIFTNIAILTVLVRQISKSRAFLERSGAGADKSFLEGVGAGKPFFRGSRSRVPVKKGTGYPTLNIELLSIDPLK